ncbi:MAG: hypothetical protein HY231_10325, partial [Acidobacteria bacterium]|nr:hypothetical protein [Acidobacteriota bacterium]
MKTLTATLTPLVCHIQAFFIAWFRRLQPRRSFRVRSFVALLLMLTLLSSSLPTAAFTNLSENSSGRKGVRQPQPIPAKQDSITTSAINGLSLSVGYADDLQASANFPVPWQGSPNVIFKGGGISFDSGALRLDNNNDSAITIDSVTVNLQRPGPQFNLWGSFTVPAHRTVILTQTDAYNFDTSNYPLVGCGGTPATGDARMPKISITTGGVTSDYLDTAHVLDTGGFNLGCQGNKSLQWRPVGTTGIANPGGRITLSANTSIQAVGTPYTVSARVADAANQALANAVVAFKILNGPNAGQTSQVTADAQGLATFTYTSALQGSDTLQATVMNTTGAGFSSEQTIATWTSSDACPAPTQPEPSATRVVYLGAKSADYNDDLPLLALLTEGNGLPLGGRTLNFAFGAQNFTAVTDAYGIARTTITPTTAPGAVPLTISFAGEATHVAAQTAETISVERDETFIQYNGKTLLGTAVPQTISATLFDGGDHAAKPLANKVVSFTVGSLKVQATTNASGVATANLTLSAAETSGPARLSIAFAGDTYYKPAVTAVPVTIYLSTSFVVWGGNAGGLRLGQRVNFWGHSWASQVTGGDFGANPSFKGFADPLNQIHICQPNARTKGSPRLDQSCWTSKPGQSFPPPLTIPAYIEVIVSTSIDKQGPTIFGNIAAAVVVKVDPNPPYDSNPGHPGYGTIVAVIEDGANLFPQPALLQATQTQPQRVLPGQPFNVVLQATNSGGTTATNVSVTENFDGLTPNTATANLGSLAATASKTETFAKFAPTIAFRQAGESVSEYQSRLAALDGRRYTSTATLNYTDASGQSYLPVEVSSFSQLQVPRLTLAVAGLPCVGPGTRIPYQVTVSNIGSATATTATALLTLPDGSTASLVINDLAPGTSFQQTVNWTVPSLAAKLASEDTPTYLTRLAAFDGKLLNATASVNWTDAQANLYGNLEQSFNSVEKVPILTFSTEGATTTLPGRTIAIGYVIRNIGGGNAVEALVQVSNPDQTTANTTPVSLAAGVATNVQTTWQVPVVAAKQAGESEAAYQARLIATETAMLNFDSALRWTDTAGNLYGPIDGETQISRLLPIVPVTISGPTAARANDTLTYTITCENLGHAEASSLDLAVTLPDGSVSRPQLATNALAVGGSVQASVRYTVPANQADGEITARAAVNWKDALQTAYGPLSASCVTTVSSINQPPVVSAGPDQSLLLPTNTLFLNGTASDDGKPTGSTLVTTWSKVSGTGTVSIANANQVVTTATFSQAGVYVMRLTGSDSQFTSSDEVTITVIPGNQPPVVNAGPDQTIIPPLNTVQLNGTASDDGLPTGSALTVLWSQVSGPSAVSFGNTGQTLTTAVFSAPGVYVLRLTANDSQYSSSDDLTITVDNPSLTLSPVTAGPNVTGTQQTLTAKLKSSNGAGIAGVPVAFTITGAHNLTGSATSNAAGEAIFNYTGINNGADAVIATANVGGTSVQSNSASINWIIPRQAISTTTVLGRYFTADGSGRFNTPPTQQPLFSQITPTINFNPPAGTVPGDTSGIGVNSRPFTNVTTDFNGNFTGTMIAQGNGFQAGTGTLFVYNAVYTGAFVASAAGNITFNFFSDDGFILGIGNGATRVSGALTNPPASGMTAFTNVPVMGAFNVPTGPVGNAITVHFPVAGVYPYELDYSECCGGALALTMATTASGNHGVPPTGSLALAPFSTAPKIAGQAIVFTVTAADASGAALVNLPITLAISGANAQQLSATTDTVGKATFVYNGSVPGTDTLQAIASVSGMQAVSNIVSQQWNIGSNLPPTVNAGADQSITPPTTSVTLNGVVTDDGKPTGGGITVQWSKVTGPGTVTFANANQAVTTATFSAVGRYVLRLSASDSSLVGNDDVVIKLSTPCTPTVSGLISWWAGEGDANDQVGSNPGVINGGITFVPGKVGQAFNLNGSNSFIQLPRINLGATFTTEFWVMPREVRDGQNLIADDYNSGNFGALYFNSSYLAYWQGGRLRAATPTGSMSANQWSHIALTHDGQVTRIYINGTLLAMSEPYSTTYNNSLRIGWATSQHLYILNGLLDEISFYNRALTDTEVAAIDLAGSNGKCKSAQTGNLPPTVNAGSDQSITLPAAAILNGTASDDGLPAGSTLTVQWSKVSGPGTVNFTNPAQAVTSATFSAAGTYVLRLTASDSQLTSTDDVGLTVNPPVNQAPTVNAGADQTIILPANASLNGTATDDGLPTGSSVSVSWSKVSGPGTVTFTNATQVATTASFTAAGSYVLRLTASDSQLSSFDEVAISVLPQTAQNQAPTVNAGADQTVSLGVNLIQNPSNEAALVNGKIANWTEVTGNAWTQATAGSNGFPTSFAGDTYFYAGDTADAELRQDVNVSAYATAIAAGTQQFALSVNVRSRNETPADSARVILEYRNAANTATLGALDSGPLTSVTGWTAISDTRAAPAGTGWLRIRLIATRNSGTGNDGYFDGVSLRPVGNVGATLQGTATDDGLPTGSTLNLTWSQVSGPGTVTFAAGNQAIAGAVFSVAGTYVLRLTANDSQLSATDDVIVTVTPPNQAPQVNAGADQSIELPTNTVNLNGTATDDGLPTGSSVSVSWTKVSGTGVVTFGDATQVATTASFTAAGVYVLRLKTNDSEFFVSDDVTITVAPQNFAPQVSAGADQTIVQPTNMATLQGTASDDGLPAGSMLVVQWAMVSGAGTVSFANANTAQTTATFSAPGVYVLRLTATDSRLTTSDDVIVTYNSSNQAPQVSAGQDQTIALPTNAVNLNGTATDDGLPAGSRVSVSWTKVSGTGVVTFGDATQVATTASFTAAGVYVLRLTATDSVLTASDDVQVTVIDPTVPVPTVAISSPTDGAEVKAPSAVVGSVSDGNWKLEYALGGDDTLAQSWTTLATGAGAVTNATLATLDTTLLLNGVYALRLTATNVNGQSASISVAVVVNGQMKVGNFTLAFADLSVPVAGLPIEVVRSYDSRDKRTGDFGVGWQLGITNVRLEKAAALGRFWNETYTGGFIPRYCLQPSKAHLITITFGDGRVFKFLP